MCASLTTIAVSSNRPLNYNYSNRMSLVSVGITIQKQQNQVPAL
jgi:hypothetical protein